ncbi:MAG TPA: M1 family aminopeptidase [Bacteroidia bacterium]|nr:M1 family aminopeptidase [Bacteroidia bacterium]
MRKLLVPALAIVMVIAACKSKKNAAQLSADEQARIADSIAVAESWMMYDTTALDTTAYDDTYYDDYNWEPEVKSLPVYQAAKTRNIDIIHTKLEVRFDYEKQHMPGKAYITLKPYFYTTDVIELDAKGFEIFGVFMVDKKNNTTPLTYEYENLEKLKIKLGKPYKANEEITLFINYTAKPNELPSEGADISIGAAITEDKGLYFINPTGEDGDKPRQVWTQGETESSSCWFPTFDSPNERFTQEIIMTVDTQDVTLSNGKLISSKVNRDGTRTDHWKQNLPHAPYLAMMAVGEFAVIKDKWRNMEVNYYVEKEYAKYARMIFGNTPEMIEFYSKKLGVDYPWEKYSQIVVRDFVAGAMENTGAVIYFDRLQHDDRQHIDEPLEEIIAHELFHHWFGDLVTTESWANLPLNESFATYGEYLWNEHAYGREEADYKLNEDLEQYMNEARDKKVDLVRFDYEKQDDMFDAHSYQKGGRVLHMLRKHVGDDAFFKALNIYLTQNKYKAVEMHQLRLAFEEVTGEDLNWFFNQWFYSSGHPELEINHEYNEEAGMYTIKVNQTQYGEGTVPPVYRLPVKIDIYEATGKRTEEIIIDESSETFEFFVTAKPRWVNFDADKMLLCTKNEYKDADQWMAQLQDGPLFMDRLEAVKKANELGDEMMTNAMYRTAIGDKFWPIRLEALQGLKDNGLGTEQSFIGKVAMLAEKDKKSSVRAKALDILAGTEDKAYAPIFKKLLNDSSYVVAGEALVGYARIDSADAVNFAEKAYTTEKSTDMKSLYLYVLGKYGAKDYMNLFENAGKEKQGQYAYLYASGLGAHMMNGDEDRVLKGLELLENVDKSGDWVMVFVIYGVQNDISEKYNPIFEALSQKKNLGTLTPEESARFEKVHAIIDRTGGFGEEEGDDHHGHQH